MCTCAWRICPQVGDDGAGLDLRHRDLEDRALRAMDEDQMEGAHQIQKEVDQGRVTALDLLGHQQADDAGANLGTGEHPMTLLY
eukprot:6477372-Amphidinium_carterae.1